MKLSALIRILKVRQVVGETGLEVTDVVFDSRKVKPGALFVAVRGSQVDGHRFVDAAILNGACVVVCEEIPADTPPGVSFLRVDNSAEALGHLASVWFGHPSHRLQVVGVTGTNGKTSIATLLFQSIRALGLQAGLLSTVANFVGDRKTEATHTTPDPMALHALLKEMADEGCEFCFMEVSSHAADQHRIDGIRFAGGIFTNLTHDHLDYHKTFDHYLAAKKRFFDLLPDRTFALTNADDRNGKVMLQNTKASRKTYSLRGSADFSAKILESHLEGTLLVVDSQEVWLPFVGKFNAYNLLAVYASLVLLGFEPGDVLRTLSHLPKVRGRFETFSSPGGVLGCVDYAHTPDALKNVLVTLNEVRPHQGRLITVMGAGGDRDRTKRPEMGRIGAELSDLLIITSDNPRSEDPDQIIMEISAGVETADQHKVLRIANRREAIRTAAIMAHQGDVLAVCGKGHEQYQEIQGVRYFFDDREELLLALGSPLN